jgi:hypothetical protein
MRALSFFRTLFRTRLSPMSLQGKRHKEQAEKKKRERERERERENRDTKTH